MSEYKTPNSPTEFHQNFAQKKPLMNSTEAYYESARCLFCYDAPCVNACPTHIDIPLFIKQIHTGNIEGAAKTIFDANWFGNREVSGSPKVSRIPHNLTIRALPRLKCIKRIGDWPSGKAVDSGSTIGGSNPSSPANLRAHLRPSSLGS